ncbi:hypothetical protein [Anaerotruncus sp. 1XD42-93]|uniref:hypothetical protein n=1 Tax=Anaerotruncus sp. 1XD42-93 TaxID=2320853 RepID=UPI000EA0EA26|nr:hypothetical protein [Anaerotruncus sp. 1XD42-93]NBK19943.1 hypothetical protein [Anaerotruncus sp. 1XD42-93]RKJ76797.1 hypothetical protein D7Y41_31495 [Anaerotruncus sp. 1XD22-93]
MDKTGAEQVIHGRSQPFFSDIKRIAKEALFAKGLFRNLFLHFSDKKKESGQQHLKFCQKEI